MDFKKSATFGNLLAGFSAESQARNKYELYAKQARSEKLIEIAELFEITAKNEQEHSKLWYKLLWNGMTPTEENLKIAAEGEHLEWSKIYKQFAETAKKEGFIEISTLFAQVAEIEQEHEIRFNEALTRLKNGTMFEKQRETVFVCRNCGYVHTGLGAPEICPVCQHARGFFIAE